MSARVPRVESKCPVCGKVTIRKRFEVIRRPNMRCSHSCATKARYPSDEERFWNGLTMMGGSECWPWKSPDHYGYGNMRFAGRSRKAHAVSWELANGQPVPDGLYVLHKCDNPACVNPAHLFVGTQQDNVDDMWAKGRANKQRTMVTLTCPGCGKDFIRWKRSLKKTRRRFFCSHSCCAKLKWIEFRKKKRVHKNDPCTTGASI